MTRIAIVEDEAAVREQLAGYVQRYTRQYGTPFEVTEFADGMEILEDYRPQFDIIFLDVEMNTWTAWRPPAASGSGTAGC